ncbi:alpha/beta fold hydrolase [Streptomyces gobitricini]|uniref:CocE/NonD family hydrolase n=1 Tax=Streptomyces gobitricini TaxID=68211 RepID=A0ABP6AHP2_9ACTN
MPQVPRFVLPAPPEFPVSSPQPAVRQRRHCVTAADGVSLEVVVYDVERAGEPQPESRPVVVLPASWAASGRDFSSMLTWLASSGYVTVGYTPRGFNGSGGMVGAAGPTDVSDFRAVLDWLLATVAAADPKRVAAVGLSYGAGISLLAAAEDDRVTAVVAMNGWADLYEALAAGDTPRLLGAALLSSGLLRGRAEPSFVRAILRFYSGLQHDELKRWSARRSASSCLERLNARPVSVLLSASWNDTVLRPDQVVDFHTALTGRSVLLLHPDDHPVVPLAQLSTASGRAVWQYARAWLDHEMRGMTTGVEGDGPVVVLRESGLEDREPLAALPSRPPTRFGLGPPRLLSYGRAAGRGGAWRSRLLSGVPTGATDRVPLVTQLMERVLGPMPAVWFPLVPGFAAARWTTDPFTDAQRLRGAPYVRLRVGCPARQVTLTAHLYEVGPAGVGRLISQGAATVNTGGRCPTSVTVRLRTTVRDVAAGHRVGLVIGSHDPTCANRTPPLRRLTLHSLDAEPAFLSLPLHDAPDAD